MSGEVVDSNPYSRLMALQRMGIVKDYEQIRNKTVRKCWRHLRLHLHFSAAGWQWIGAATQEAFCCLLPCHTHLVYTWQLARLLGCCCLPPPAQAVLLHPHTVVSAPHLLWMVVLQVAVVGVGGVGSVAAEMLTRCGVGRLLLYGECEA